MRHGGIEMLRRETEWGLGATVYGENGVGMRKMLGWSFDGVGPSVIVETGGVGVGAVV